jgi:hypothetical protein
MGERERGGAGNSKWKGTGRPIGRDLSAVRGEKTTYSTPSFIGEILIKEWFLVLPLIYVGE